MGRLTMTTVVDSGLGPPRLRYGEAGQNDEIKKHVRSTCLTCTIAVVLLLFQWHIENGREIKYCLLNAYFY